jgi:hypothetical protein
MQLMDAAFWNGRYAAPRCVYGVVPNGFLATLASHIPAGPVLCPAEGEGRKAVQLAALGHRVTAVDQSDTSLIKAPRLAAQRGVELEKVVSHLANFIITPGAWGGIVAVFPTCQR